MRVVRNITPMKSRHLYMDSDSTGAGLRWDDPKAARRDRRGFVTVEPHGGQPEATGKPFLYALLRKERITVI